MAVTGQLREALARSVGLHGTVVHLTGNRALEYRGVDKRRCRMRMALRMAAGTILDEHSLDALARNIRQLVLVHERDPRIGRLRSVGDGVSQRCRSEKQRAEESLHDFGLRMRERAVQDLMNARRSGLMTSARVVHMPWGNFS